MLLLSDSANEKGHKSPIRNNSLLNIIQQNMATTTASVTPNNAEPLTTTADSTPSDIGSVANSSSTANTGIDSDNTPVSVVTAGDDSHVTAVKPDSKSGDTKNIETQLSDQSKNNKETSNTAGSESTASVSAEDESAAAEPKVRRFDDLHQELSAHEGVRKLEIDVSAFLSSHNFHPLSLPMRQCSI